MGSDVAILGVGHSEFGTLEGEHVTDFGAEAVREAIQHSNVTQTQIDEAYVGNVGSAAQVQTGSVGQAILRNVGIGGIPVTRLENACSSSSCALREAARAIRSGDADIALAMGVEKMTGVPTDVAMSNMAGTSYAEIEGAMGISFMGMYGCVANAYQDHFDRDITTALSQISVKSHRNGALNPRAHFQREITIKEVKGSPIVADPLRLYHCSPMSDGGTAVVLCRADLSQEFHDHPVLIESIKMGTWSPGGSLYSDTLTKNVAEKAYNEAEITPSDIDVIELHDASSVGELIRCEALGLCESGTGPDLVLNEKTSLDGRIPVNPSGGLKSRGHPIGATGIAQICELVWQLRGQAGRRQVPSAEIGVAQNAGGSLFGKTATSTVTVLKSQRKQGS